MRNKEFFGTKRLIYSAFCPDFSFPVHLRISKCNLPAIFCRLAIIGFINFFDCVIIKLSGGTAMSNIIEVKNLVKNYKDVQAVRDISFSVKEGSFFAFLGVNGAGKSTTINILCTVLEKTSGKITIGGFDLDKDAFAIKDLIGIVFQGSVLDKPLTVRDNLVSRAAYYGLSKADTKARIDELTEQFELTEIIGLGSNSQAARGNGTDGVPHHSLYGRNRDVRQGCCYRHRKDCRHRHSSRAKAALRRQQADMVRSQDRRKRQAA